MQQQPPYGQYPPQGGSGGYPPHGGPPGGYGQQPGGYGQQPGGYGGPPGGAPPGGYGAPGGAPPGGYGGPGGGPPPGGYGGPSGSTPGASGPPGTPGAPGAPGSAPGAPAAAASGATGSGASAGAAAAPAAPPTPKFPKEEDIVKLNVGGCKFQTTLATLRSRPNSRLSEMFAKETLEEQKPGKDGFYFIDRNGDAFETVLEFYRTGKILHKSKKVPEAVIHEELAYWGIAENHQSQVDISIRPMFGDQLRQMTLQAVYRERYVLDQLIGYFHHQLREEAAYGRTTSFFLFGEAPSSTSKTSPIKGRAVHLPGAHEWLTSRPANLATLVQALERDGLVVTVKHGQPTSDYIQLQLSWPFADQDFSSYAWK